MFPVADNVPIIPHVPLITIIEMLKVVLKGDISCCPTGLVVRRKYQKS
jgi:hypothetical protein